MRTLLRIHPATSGEAIFEGHDLMKSSGEQLRQDRKNIQMVFQDPTAAFNPKMLVKDILTEAFEKLRPDKKQRGRRQSSRAAGNG